MPSPFLDIDKEKGYGELIEKLVEARRAPIETLERNKEKERLKITFFDEISKDFSDLRNYARRLYGVNSVFRKLKFDSDQPSTLEGSAFGIGLEGEYAVRIKEIAKAHRIASRSVSPSLSLPAGIIRLRVGEQDIVLNFKGGTLRDLERLFFNSAYRSHLDMAVVRQNKKNAIVILSAAKTGKKNIIHLIEDESGLFTTSLGLFTLREIEHFDLFQTQPDPQSGEESAGEELLQLPPGESRVYENLDVPFPSDHVLVFEARWQKLSPERLESRQVDWSMRFQEIQRIEFGDLSFESFSLLPFPSGETVRQKESVKTNAGEGAPLFLVLEGEGDGEAVTRSVLLPEGALTQEKGEEIYRLALESPASSRKKLRWMAARFTNTSQTHDYFITSPVLKSVDSESRYRPAKEIDSAKDTILSYKGVDVERDSNEVDDLIPGIRLKLLQASEGEIKFSVEPDEEAIFAEFARFLAQFNMCTEKMNIAFSSKRAPPDEEEDRQKRYGLFQGELTFRLLRDRFRNLLTRPYPTSQPQTLSILPQIGLSPVYVPGDPYHQDAGKLDLEEAKYLTTFRAYPRLVAELFGYTSGESLIINSGIAYEMSSLLRQYIGPAGIFRVNRETVERRIKDLDRDITKKKKELDTYRKKQEREFSQLQSAQDRLERMQKMLEKSQ